MLEETHIHTCSNKKDSEQSFEIFKGEKWNTNCNTEPLSHIFVISINRNGLKLSFCFKN